MPSTSFLPICLDLASECLWRGAQAIPLRPKTFAVLRYLLDHPGQLLTKTAILDAVWPGITIGDGGLMVCMHELRRALGDDPKAPRYIETLPRRGYRFIGHIPLIRHPASLSPQSSSLSPVAPVGRKAEMAYLQERLERALRGARQVVFVTGEGGLGKTTLIDAFVEAVGRDRRLWVGRGQCIEHYGAGEAYMPVLEAFGGLCREPEGQKLVQCLAQHAPTWLAQMPGLVSASDLEALQRQVMGATRERMLRELATAIEVFTDAQALVLVLEDLHWGDYSTLDLLTMLGRRREPARLLVLGTYRPEDVLRQAHPLQIVQHELHIHGRCETLPLTLLTEVAIAAYLTACFPGLPMVERLAHFVHQRTDGNPLFMVNVVENWLAQGILVERDGLWTLPAGFEALPAGVPESLRQMIAQRLKQLSAEYLQVVEAASVAGAEFSAAAVAAALSQEVAWVETSCTHLARQGQLLRLSGERAWPNGVVATCYSFIHALYQEVVYNQVPAAQRVNLHRRIGEGLEAGYGTLASDIAAELAMHFERGRDARRAITYLRQAAGNTLRRYANREAIEHLTKGLALIHNLPETPERTREELDLLIALGPALMAARGYGALEVERTYAQALRLCQHGGETSQIFPVLVGLQRFYLLRAELQTARELGERLLTMAQSARNVALLLTAHYRQGPLLVFQGEFALAREHMEYGVALYDAQRSRSHIFLHGDDAGVGCLSYLALALWFLGYADQALERMHAALARARELAHPFSLAYALIAAAWLHQYRREEQATQTYAEEALALSRQQGIPLREAQGTIMRGWALTAQGLCEEGIAGMHQGLEAFRATGAELNRTYYLLLLAEAYGQRGQVDAGLRALTDALAGVHRGRERWWEAELHRLKGELVLQRRGTAGLKLAPMRTLVRAGATVNVHGRAPQEAEAKACFRQALHVARRQQAKSLELRAAMSMSRLWQQRGQRTKARQVLAEVYSWFTEGFETPDLREARGLLAEL
ncbi:MAG TPA: AAA family ATPase [Candidatus Tectomicrobia bacterium]|nr:AAA family ATPase [Candidatus Tectomicrobia bacterium]